MPKKKSNGARKPKRDVSTRTFRDPLAGQIIKKISEAKVRTFQRKERGLIRDLPQVVEAVKSFKAKIKRKIPEHERLPDRIKRKKVLLERRQELMRAQIALLSKMTHTEKTIYGTFSKAKQEMDFGERSFGGKVLKERTALFEEERDFDKALNNVMREKLFAIAEAHFYERRKNYEARIKKYCNDCVRLVMPDWKKREPFVEAFFTPKEKQPDLPFPKDAKRPSLSKFCETLAREQRYKMVYFGNKHELVNIRKQLEALEVELKEKDMEEWAG